MPLDLPLAEETLEVLSKADGLLVGVSGGRDSVVLLEVLVRNSIPGLQICHLNHGLRGMDSHEDEVFVRSLANRHSLPCHVKSIQITELQKKSGRSLEVEARLARHEFFAEISENTDIRHLALGHHADDQAETVLMNLMRGSAGLRGMSPQSPLEVNKVRLTLHRPLLRHRRELITAYATAHTIKWREDLSNQEPHTPRNRLRQEVLPLLSEIFTRDVAQTICRSERMCRESQHALDLLLGEKETYLDPQGRLFLPKLTALPQPAQRIIVQWFLQKNGVSNLSEALLTRCVNVCNRVGEAKTNLPKDRFLQRREKRAFLSEGS